MRIPNACFLAGLLLMENKPNISLIGFIALCSVATLFVYHFWNYVVAVLAMCGAYYLIGIYRK